MAFGIGKAFKKGWKKAFGWADDDITKSVATGLVVGALTGGLGGLALGAAGVAGATATSGAIMGGLAGAQQGMSYYNAGQQKKMVEAQIASAEKIAAMQNQPVVQAAATPTAAVQDAMISEENEASARRRAFSFAKTQRMGSVARRNTLG